MEAAGLSTPNVRLLLWDNEPEVPVSEIVVLEGAMLAAAEKVTLCCPVDDKVNVAGVAVTPLGTPLTAMLT